MEPARRCATATSRCSASSATQPWVYFVHSLHGVPDDPAGRRRDVRVRRRAQRRVPARQRVRHPVPPREVGHAPACDCSPTSSTCAPREHDDRAVPGDRPARRSGRAPVAGRLRRPRPCTATTRSRSPSGVRRRRRAVGARRRPRRRPHRRPGQPAGRGRASPPRSPVAAGSRPAAACARVADVEALAAAGVARVVMGSAAVARSGARRRGVGGHAGRGRPRPPQRRARRARVDRGQRRRARRRARRCSRRRRRS